MRRIHLLLVPIVATLGACIYVFGALQSLSVAFVVLLGVCALLSWTFVIRHARTAWWASHGGRYLMKSKTALAMLFSLWIFSQVVPLRPLTASALAVVLFSWIAYVLVDLLSMQNREIKAARAERWITGPRDLARDADRDLRRDGPRDIARDAEHDSP